MTPHWAWNSLKMLIFSFSYFSNLPLEVSKKNISPPLHHPFDFRIFHGKASLSGYLPLMAIPICLSRPTRDQLTKVVFLDDDGGKKILSLDGKGRVQSVGVPENLKTNQASNICWLIFPKLMIQPTVYIGLTNSALLSQKNPKKRFICWLIFCWLNSALVYVIQRKK